MFKLKKKVLYIGFALAVPLISGIASACSTARNVNQGNQGTTEPLPGGSNNQPNPEQNSKETESQGNNNQTKPEQNNKQDESKRNNNQTQPEKNNKQSEEEIKKEKETVVDTFNKIPATATTKKNNENILPSTLVNSLIDLGKVNEQLDEKNKIRDAPNEFEYLFSAEGNDDDGILKIKIGLRKKGAANFFNLDGNRSTTQVNKEVSVSGYQNNKDAALSFYKKITQTNLTTKNPAESIDDVAAKFLEKTKSSSISEQIQFINEQIKEENKKIPSDLTAPDTFDLKISANKNAPQGRLTFKFSLLKKEKIYNTDGSSRNLDPIFEKNGKTYMSGKDVDVLGYTKTNSSLKVTPSTSKTKR